MSKTRRDEKDINLIKGGKSFYMTLIICLVVFLSAITLLLIAFNRLISRHDQHLSGEICTIMSEKMNTSIAYMTRSTLGMASVLSAQGFSSPDDIYETLKSSSKSDYLSVGFIDADGKLYSTAEEAAEFTKWSLFNTAKEAAPVSMSAPYRSSVYGQPVITLFAAFEYGNSKHGYMFTTYMLKDLQSVAVTESMGKDIEIWLMDARSANVIQCAGADERATGSWTNAYLTMQNVNKEDMPVYNDWLNRMRSQEDSIGISYSIGNTIYSQYCSKIISMPGWYVVVRIPSSALSATMNIFRNYVLEFLAVLLFVVIVLIANMYRLSKRENKMLNQLSIHDPLTGSLNRRAFDFAAEKKLGHGKSAALIFFDIDFFKQVNDQFGHDAGDKLLVAFSDTLKNNFRDRGIIARFGGDEFVVLTDMDSIEEINELLGKTTDDVHSIDLTDERDGGRGFMISFSAGAAAYPKDADTLSYLKKCADMALYSTKEMGRNGYTWFAPGMIDPKANPIPDKVDEITHKPVYPDVPDADQRFFVPSKTEEAPKTEGTPKADGTPMAEDAQNKKKVVKKVIRRKVIKKVVKKTPPPAQ